MTRPGLTLLLLLALAPLPGAAQVLSPGPLSSAHASLEGLGNCTKCHGGGERVSRPKCLACHPELGRRIGAGEGLHGRMAEAERACERCHPEHRGRDFELVDWGGDRRRFDHARTGYRLTGGHRKVRCEGCHDVRLVEDPDVRALLAKKARKSTYLGLPQTCSACHFDEHRGQLSKECSRCHDTRAFAPATGFDHARTDYPLTGRHAKVACEKCHPAEADEVTAAGAFPKPVKRTFARYDGIAAGRCTDCHKDPHVGRLGSGCERCHDTSGWKRLRPGAMKSTAFHDKTRYPLRGAHQGVPCASCHAPGGGKARYKGLAFQRCTDCHRDGHLGQLAGKDCEGCHDVEGFLPPRYTPEDHARTPYALEGAHLAVACAGCHPRDARLAARVPERLQKRLRRAKRPLLVSTARFDLPQTSRGCVGCHPDPHGGQLSARRCEDCHRTASFRELAFDHDRDSRYPLEGAHAKVACERCHGRPAPGAPVTYRPLDTRCAACHTDVHLGQFAYRDAGCETCHDPRAFKPSRFDHARPEHTRYTLRGRHEKLACEKCHHLVEAEGLELRRYRPLPEACEGCHEDPHRGAFQALAPFPGAPTAGCASCHDEEGWRPARFDHAWTGFALRDAHLTQRCESCHRAGYEAPLPSSCAGCHQDPHRGQVGLDCAACHDETRWRRDPEVEPHARTLFPLTGRHALIPCQECHLEQRDATFSAVTVSCASCHAGELARAALTSVDHAAAGFSEQCEACHTPARFSPARWTAHDACFQISAGEHAGIRCLDCHRTLTGLVVSGACATFNAACTGCHEHAQGETDEKHREVPGYQYKDRKCYECHRFAR